MGSKANPPGFAQPGQPGASPYQQAAEGQAAQSHVGMQGPVGQSGWTQGPNGQWTQSQQFSGPFQQAFQGLGSQIAGQGPLDTGADARQKAEQAAYGSATSRLDPMFAQREQQERSMLSAQGLDPGSEAGRNEMFNFNRGRNDAYSQAQRYAVGQGLQAQHQQYSQLQQLMGMLPGQGV